jgi:hypothetical protein
MRRPTTTTSSAFPEARGKLWATMQSRQHRLRVSARGSGEGHRIIMACGGALSCVLVTIVVYRGEITV